MIALHSQIMTVPAVLAFAGLIVAREAPQPDRVRDYLALAQETLKNPISHSELEAAALSREGIAAISRLFEDSLAQSLTLAGQVVTPELGGEATLLEGRLSWAVYPDPKHALVRRLVELKGDPAAMLAFLNGSAEGREILQSTGGLHALLYQMSGSPGVATRERQSLLDQVLLSAAAIHFKTWTADPRTQMEGIQKNDWRGRYVGFWHIHPPRVSAHSPPQRIEPSTADMLNAIEKGQFLTIVFQPDGFDFYDLSPLAEAGKPDLSRARKISHRSAQWEAAFRSLIRRHSGAVEGRSRR
jgi:hypothetical protein